VRIGKRSRFAGVAALLILAAALNALALHVAWHASPSVTSASSAAPHTSPGGGTPGGSGTAPGPASAASGQQSPPSSASTGLTGGIPTVAGAGAKRPEQSTSPRASAPEFRWPALFGLVALGILAMALFRKRQPRGLLERAE